MKGINYVCRTSQIADSGDYDSDLQVFLNDTCIAHCGEGEELHIQGDFRDYIETGTSTDGIPDVEHKSFYLDVIDLINLNKIMMWWLYETEPPKELERL
jgi:hypothetical protein